MAAKRLEADPGVVVAATAANGLSALDQLKRHPVDVLILDIERPVMDDLTALSRIGAEHPTVRVLMSSTLTQFTGVRLKKAIVDPLLAGPAFQGESLSHAQADALLEASERVISPSGAAPPEPRPDSAGRRRWPFGRRFGPWVRPASQ